MTATITAGATEKIRLVESAAELLADAIAHEDATIRFRDELRMQLVDSLLGQPNARTGKVHSETSAKVAAEETEQWKAAEEIRCRAERDKIMASARYETARLTARLAVNIAGGDPTDDEVER